MKTKYNNRAYWTSLHRQHVGQLSAVGYSGMGEGFNRAAYRLRLGAAEHLLRRNAVQPQKILEAAVGVGAYEPLWRELGVQRWVGVDMSPDAIAGLQARSTGTFLVADLTSDWNAQPLLGSGFDLVTAIDVLYHLVEDDEFARALVNLGERVRAGGYLLVSDVFCDPTRQIAPHVKRRALGDYLAILEPGFHPLDREAVFAILGDPVPRPARPIGDVVLFNAWRVLSKVVRVTPALARNIVGAATVAVASPVDSLLRKCGAARGRNLELLLFRKQS